MRHARLAIPLLGLLLIAAAPPRSRFRVSTKATGSFPILYVEHYGPYKQVEEMLREVAAFAKEEGLRGRLIAVYHDNPHRTASSALRSDVGIVVTEGELNRLVGEFRPDLEGKAEEREKEIHSEVTLLLTDPYKVRRMEPRLVAATRVHLTFQNIPRVYTDVRDWIWANNYYLIGPIVELFERAPEPERPVSAEVQLAIERTGVPDRR